MTKLQIQTRMPSRRRPTAGVVGKGLREQLHALGTFYTAPPPSLRTILSQEKAWCFHITFHCQILWRVPYHVPIPPRPHQRTIILMCFFFSQILAKSNFWKSWIRPYNDAPPKLLLWRILDPIHDPPLWWLPLPKIATRGESWIRPCDLSPQKIGQSRIRP